jgi:hypothetical protein
MRRDSVPFRVTTTRGTPTDGQAGMTICSGAESDVRLKEVRTGERTFFFVGGFALLVVSPMIVAGLARGEWSSLLLTGVPATFLVVGHCFRCFTPDDYLVLHPDRMEFPRRRGESQIVTWSDVTAVHWPRTHDSSARIVLSLAPETDRPLGKAWIALDHLSPADRLTCIRYLRSAAAGIQQVDWPQFCRKRAIRLAEMMEAVGNETMAWGSGLHPAAQPEPCVEFFNQHSFVAGVTFPVMSLLVLCRSSSRSLWWNMATIIAISGAINIRLVWGVWASPFTEIVMGFAAGLFCVGLLAPSKVKDRNRSEDVPPLLTVGSLALAIIGGPLLGNAMVIGWVQIPKAAAGLIGPAFCFVLLFPALFAAARRRRTEKRQTAALEADAIRRWEAYVQTGTLPDAAEHDVGGTETRLG